MALKVSPHMSTSSNGNIFRVTGPLCGEFTGHRWIPLKKRPVVRSFDIFFDLRLNKRLSNNHEAGDLRRHHAYYDVTVVDIGVGASAYPERNCEPLLHEIVRGFQSKTSACQGTGDWHQSKFRCLYLFCLTHMSMTKPLQKWYLSATIIICIWNRIWPSY